MTGKGAQLFTTVCLKNEKTSGPKYSNLKNLLMFINLFELNNLKKNDLNISLTW